MPFGKLQVGCHVPFTEEWLLSGHSTIKACLVEGCRDGCPSGRFSHLPRGTLKLCQTDHWVLDHVPDKVPFPTVAQFGQGDSSKKCLGGSRLLPFKIDGGHRWTPSCRNISRMINGNMMHLSSIYSLTAKGLKYEVMVADEWHNIGPQDLITVSLCIQIAIDKMQLCLSVIYAWPYVGALCSQR